MKCPLFEAAPVRPWVEGGPPMLYAAAAVERASSLIKSGSVSTVEMARLTREQAIAQQTEIGARRRLDAGHRQLNRPPSRRRRFSEVESRR